MDLTIAKALAITTIGILSCYGAITAQERPDCATDVLAKTERQIGHLPEGGWRAFFESLDPRCKGDTKYMGWVNDLLFRTLESQPTHFIQAFEALPRVKQRLILDELSSPRHAGLDATRTYDLTRNVAGPEEPKQRILQALTKAGCRCETEIIE